MSLTNDIGQQQQRKRRTKRFAPVRAAISGVAPIRFTHDAERFLLGGRPVQICSGELHYFRVPRAYWRDRLLKAKALGLNAVCTYMPWNLHEPRPGTFDFVGDGGMLDVAAFVREAQELGLWVILRPGPYICAEWDFGGLPGWLLADPDCRIRCADPNYLAAVGRYVARVGAELSSLTCGRGGPIVMVQVENEYGSYSNDKEYLARLRDMLRGAGFDEATSGVLLFTSDGTEPEMLAAGSLDGTLAVANFGSKAADQLAALRAFRPGQPLMCGEFWCGWFDQWGKRRQGTADPTACIDDVRWMKETGASFNFYMFHGGTNFGFTSGANYYDAYSPTVTGYDYFALLDEAGRPTAKYEAVREVLGGVGCRNGRPAPLALPAGRFRRTGSASLFDSLPAAVRDAATRPMECYGQYAGGAVLYRTAIDNLGGGGTLRVVEPHDYAVVYLDGARVGALDRRLAGRTVELPPAGGHRLDILVWSLGRVNYGPRMLDRKGITERVEIGRLTLSNWDVFPLPMDPASVAATPFARQRVDGPAFHRFTVDLHASEVRDIFLDLRGGWTLGAVWVNGHNLGRFWRVGPQQTLFCPGCWLRPGANEVVVFDLESSGRLALSAVAEPVLDEIPE